MWGQPLLGWTQDQRPSPGSYLEIAVLSGPDVEIKALSGLDPGSEAPPGLYAGIAALSELDVVKGAFLGLDSGSVQKRELQPSLG